MRKQNRMLSAQEYAELEELVSLGLQTDGEHHKQWCLEEIGGILGFDVGNLRDCAEPGIAP